MSQQAAEPHTLCGAAGAAALAAADTVVDRDPLAAVTALRAAGFDPSLAAAALTQAALRRRAVAKFGADAAAMFFTRAGLEQATRGLVSRRRAARLAASLRLTQAPRDGGEITVADLGCGIGADAVALARAGMRVAAVEIDPETAAVARANAAALGLADRIGVTIADACATPLDGVDAVFCDPARRTGTGRRVFDPAAYRPPWDFVMSLPSRVPVTVLKLAPGIDHALLPAGCEGEWVSVDGDVVEAACWCGPPAAVPRRASVLRSTGEAFELTGSGERTGDVAAPRRYLYDPDGAVVRAHLVAEFADTVDGTLADPTIAYVYSDQRHPSPFARCYEIIDPLPVAVKRLRAALRARGIGHLTILKRGSALDVERLRRDLRLTGDATAVLVMTRVAGAPAALLCR